MSKRMKAVVEKVEAEKLYTVEEALSLAKDTDY